MLAAQVFVGHDHHFHQREAVLKPRLTGTIRAPTQKFRGMVPPAQEVTASSAKSAYNYGRNFRGKLSSNRGACRDSATPLLETLREQRRHEPAHPLASRPSWRGAPSRRRQKGNGRTIAEASFAHLHKPAVFKWLKGRSAPHLTSVRRRSIQTAANHEAGWLPRTAESAAAVPAHALSDALSCGSGSPRCQSSLATVGCQRGPPERTMFAYMFSHDGPPIAAQGFCCWPTSSVTASSTKLPASGNGRSSGNKPALPPRPRR